MDTDTVVRIAEDMVPVKGRTRDDRSKENRRTREMFDAYLGGYTDELED